MQQILSSDPLVYFYLLSFTIALTHFVFRFTIGGGDSKPSESLYNFILSIYGHYIGNVIFIFPLFFWYKFNFWTGVVTMMFCLFMLFVIPIFLIKVSKSIRFLQLIHLYIKIGFFLIPYLVYLILEFDYSVIHN
jgi:hypothetical protein